MFPEELFEQATELLAQCRAQGVMIATAESCTGGLISALLTDISGSSAVVDRGFVTYSNEAKMHMLGVDDALIAEHGAVSEPVARAMAEGALRNSNAQLSVSVTGVAGPGGGSVEKPVGTVHFGCAYNEQVTHSHQLFTGNREQVRLQAVEHAIALMRTALQ